MKVNIFYDVKYLNRKVVIFVQQINFDNCFPLFWVTNEILDQVCGGTSAHEYEIDAEANDCDFNFRKKGTSLCG